MQDIPLISTDYRRSVAKNPFLPLINRYVEGNPALNDSQVSVIARPGMTKALEVGSGPARGLFSSAGAFGDRLFVVSGDELYTVNPTTLATNFVGNLGADITGDVSFAATSPIGTEVPSYLFIADGGTLYVYTDNGPAFSTLTVNNFTVDNNDTVSMGGVFYRWTSGSVDAGTPAGTSANPWLVKLGATPAESFQNLSDAVLAIGDPGVTYSNNLTVGNAFVIVTSFTGTEFTVEAREPGPVGNSIVVTSSTPDLSWDAGTLLNGGDERLTDVRMPDDVGAISVAYINSFVIVVPKQEDAFGTTGKFYWIEPGERIVNPLNFANAERSPDRINQVITFGDMFWLFGDTTTEPWVTTGSQDAPMQRFQGILFDRGSWPGTAVKVRDVMIVVDEEGGVFKISNGQQRISNPSIEERIRKSIAKDI